MRCFKTPSFDKSLSKSEISDADLKTAMNQVAQGLIEAHLGGELIKKRVARPNAGKSGSYRTIIAFRRDDRAVFLHLFAKNEKANINKQELEALKALASHYLKMNPSDIDIAVEQRALMEIDHVKNT